MTTGYRNLMTICLAAALAFGLAACGGSSSDDQATVTPTPEPTPPTVYPVTLPDGHGLSVGTTSIAAGETEMTDAGTHIACAGTEDCEFTITMDPVTGAVTATSTGGMVTLTTEAGRHAATTAANKTTLADAQAALTAVQARYFAGNATKNELDAAKKAVADAKMLAGNEPTPTPEPVPDPVLVADLVDDIDAAKMLVAALGDDASDGDIQAAKDAIATATATLSDVENLSDDAKNAYELAIDTIDDTLKIAETSIMTARKAADDANAKAMAAAGKALKKALGDKPLANLGLARLDNKNNLRSDLTSAGLAVAITDATDAANATASPRMKAGASAGALGEWEGTHYAKTNTGTKVTDSAIVYTNRTAPTMKSFVSSQLGADGKFAPLYNAATRTLKLSITTTADQKIAGAKFPTAGTQIFTTDPLTKMAVIPGTYQGASGSYTCTDSPCEAKWSSSGISLEKGTWNFVHEAGAMVSIKDANYLYFGWWLRTKDGKPTMASAFHGMRGTTINALQEKPKLLNGSATYAGSAAGKFAINDPLSGGDGGDFTADATLTAKFGKVDKDSLGGISGTIDNFMANDNSVPWSVSLKLAPWKATDKDGKDSDTFGNPVVEDELPTDYATVGKGTVWSIDGTSAAASGSWQGQVYDENAKDGSDVPTSVTGQFQSQFGSTHSMVGAFGATKQ